MIYNVMYEHTNQDAYARKQILSYNLENAVAVFDYVLNIYEEQTLLYLCLIAETSPQTLFLILGCVRDSHIL